MNALLHQSAVLQASGITSGYGNRLVLEDLSISVLPGDRIALIGPNGSGKSTLLRTISGSLLIRSGALLLNGTDVSHKRVYQRARGGIAYLKQTGNVFNDLTVYDNLDLVARATQTKSVAGSRIEFILDVFQELVPLQFRRAGLLSGGQRQMLGLAMALSRRCALLLLDEPIAGLAMPAAQQLLLALDRLQQAEGIAILVAEHRLSLVQPFVSRVVVMREGAIVDDTTDTRKMLDADWLAAHYGLNHNHTPAPNK